jgi:hypothetical protein
MQPSFGFEDRQVGRVVHGALIFLPFITGHRSEKYLQNPEPPPYNGWPAMARSIVRIYKKVV